MVFLGIAVVVVLQLAFIYAPAMQAVFDTAPITVGQLGRDLYRWGDERQQTRESWFVYHEPP